MNQQERDQLSVKITECAFYFGKTDLDRPKITIMINIFEKFFENSCDEIIRAYELYMKDPKNRFFPSPSQMREYLDKKVSPDDFGKVVAGKIILSVKKFGWNKPQEAKEFIGSEGWDVVETWGGWEYICQNLGDSISITTFQAQTRDLVKSNKHTEIIEQQMLEEKKKLVSSTKGLEQFGFGSEEE